MLLHEILQEQLEEDPTDFVRRYLGLRSIDELTTDSGAREITFYDDPYRTVRSWCKVHGPPRFKKIGSGSQANVFLDTAQPNTVLKLLHIQSERDGYWQFINDSATKYKNNPFFPRIYDYHWFRPNLGFVVMEKLIPLHNIKLHTAVRFLFKQFGVDPDKYATFEPPDFDTLHKAMDHPNYQKLSSDNRRRAFYKLNQQLHRQQHTPDVDPKWDQEKAKQDRGYKGMFGPGMRNLSTQFNDTNKILAYVADNSPNESARERRKYLIALKKEYTGGDFGLDLHEGNWATRLTGHGPQLVILDPIYAP